MNDYNLITIRTIGRGGSYFLQNLFDSHKDILTIPVILPLYYHWHLFNKFQKKNITELTDYFFTETDLRYFFPENERTDYKFIDSDGSKKFINISPEKFRKNILETLQCYQIEFPSRKEFLIILHEAFAKTVNIDTQNKKYILLHEHYGYEFEEMFTDFPESKTIITTREIGNSYASFIKLSFINTQKLFTFDLNTNLFVTKDNEINSFIVKKEYPKKLKFVKIEELNKNPEKILKSLCLFLNIKYSETLFHPTILGNTSTIWSMFTENNKTSSFNPESATSNRWTQLCSKKEIELIRLLFPYVDSKYHTNKKASFLYIIYLIILPHPRSFFKQFTTINSKIYYFLTFAFFLKKIFYLKILFQGIRQNKANISTTTIIISKIIKRLLLKA